MARRRRRAFRPTGKFYMFLAAIVACAVLVCFFVLGGDTTTAQEGSMDYETQRQAVIVRDEQVIAAETFERVNYLVPDQQRVEAGTDVAEVYKWGYNDKVMNDLIDVETRIVQYDQNNLPSASADLKELDDRIAEQTSHIRAIARGEDGDVISAERELQSLMDERTQYLREHAAQNDRTLEDYYKQEQQLRERVRSWVDVWQAPSAGVVSYYYDGYEPIVNAQNIRTISATTVRNILDGTATMAQAAEGAQPLYRLVNNFQWFIVIPADEPVLEFANENVFRVTFEDYPDREFEGIVIGSITEGESRLYVLQFSEDIGSLVNTRRAQVTLRTTFSGIEVPDSALKTVNGQLGVEVVQDRQHTFVPVQVKIIRDGKAIVLPLEAGTGLSAGTSVEN